MIVLPTVEAVIGTNKLVCKAGGNPHKCLDSGKIESAIASVFYPGSAPFAHGGLAKVAGALCFYIVKTHAFLDGNKRTGALVAITFLNIQMEWISRIRSILKKTLMLWLILLMGVLHLE